MSVLSTLRIPYIPTVICKCIHSVSYQISHSLRAGLIKNYGNMWTAFVASFQCVVGELGQTAPPCMPPNAGHFHARLHLLHAIKIPEKVTNFWQPLSLWYIPIFLGLPIFHFCIFHGFSILIEIYAHNPMRRGVGEVRGMQKLMLCWKGLRAAHFGHVFAKKCCKLLKMFEIYMPKGKWAGHAHSQT